MTDQRWPSDAAVEAAVSAFHAPLHNMTVLDRMRAALLAADRAAWQDISTAPKTSMAIQVWCPERSNIYLVTWWPGSGYLPGWVYFGGHGGLLQEEPTHWRPLPADPAPPARGDGE